MSTEYAGEPSNVTTPITKTLTDASNTTPIVCTTSANHGYSTGDYVEVTGVAGNTAANGGWRIIVLTVTTFSLTGSVGNGVPFPGGTVKDQSLTPAIVRPADGDLRSAASVNAALDDLADWSQFLTRRTRPQQHTWTANGTVVVPVDCYEMTFEGTGGGGGGGGAHGNNTGTSGTGGGGAKRGRVTVAVVPGETITIACGAGGTAGTGGSGGGSAATAGGHGANTTVTGSTSGLLATFLGAMGGNLGLAAVAAQVLYGGLPVKLDPAHYTTTAGYIGNLIGGGVGSFEATMSGQGGMIWAGSGTEPDRVFRAGGGTAYAFGGYGGSTVVNSGTGSGGGASEWPGGAGGDGGLTVNQPGSAGTLGSGGGGGSSTISGGVAGGAGGVGGTGVCKVTYRGTLAVYT